ncbi:MAG: hypothetical protein JKY55_14780 [Aliivibrio sp.]|uniref:hypothetical protein n=1 Tax=Aliivibrio sp. TaxID=1872443 RepID=UPI001A4793A1|nr:hypothetical protein [Aliivibrio sp.]
MKILKWVGCLTMIAALAGCGSSPKTVEKKIDVGESFSISKFEINLEEYVTPEIVYHTNDEISALVNTRVLLLLKEKNLISTDPLVNKIDISATYLRRFAGDQTPFPSDSLAYPNYDFTLNVHDDTQSLKTVKKSNLTYRGGFGMNLKVMGGALRSKEDEIPFIEALANTIANEIENL